MMMTRLGMICLTAMLWSGPAGAAGSPPPRDMAQQASQSANGQACLSVAAKDFSTSYWGYPSSTGHTQEISTQSGATVITYTCPIERGVVVVAKLGRNLFGGCRFADRYEMTFNSTVRRLKIDGTQRDCVASVLSTSGS